MNLISVDHDNDDFDRDDYDAIDFDDSDLNIDYDLDFSDWQVVVVDLNGNGVSLATNSGSTPSIPCWAGRCGSSALVPRMNDGASVLFFTSSSVRQPIENLDASNVLRPGVAALAKCLANELGPRIRVNSLAPGRIDTPRTRSLDESRAEAPGHTGRRSAPERERGDTAGAVRRTGGVGSGCDLPSLPRLLLCNRGLVAS